MNGYQQAMLLTTAPIGFIIAGPIGLAYGVLTAVAFFVLCNVLSKFID
jgi:hypothetical protein